MPTSDISVASSLLHEAWMRLPFFNQFETPTFVIRLMNKGCKIDL